MSETDGPRRLSAVLPWIARGAWLTVIGGGGAIDAAIDGRSDGLVRVTTFGSWALWGSVVIALVIPSVRSLAWIRVFGPLSVAATIAVAIGGAPAVDLVLLGVPSLVACFAFFAPEVGGWMVQASAYGDEDRLLLRAPVAVGAAAIVSWVLWAAAVLIGPLSIGAGNWLLGVPLTVVALLLFAYIGPRWLRITQRWLVLVPAGLVVHDPVVLADTLMVRTRQLAGIGLARTGTDAADLTGPASGYAVEINTSETVSTVLAFTPAEPNGRAIHMTGFLVAPTRPGDALRRASARGLPVR